MARVRSKTGAQVVETPGRSPANRTMALVGIGVALALLVAAMVVIGNGGLGDGPTQPTGEDAALFANRVIGPEDATLVITDYSDFRCPHCRDAASQLTPQIIENYVKTGKVRFEFIPVAVLSQESVVAAEAALCADDQGKFWAFHDVLFDRQGRDEFNVENVTRMADSVGMDAQELRDCVVSGKYRDQVQRNNQAYGQSGGTGTPTFVIGDQMFSGSIPFDQVSALIDQQLGSGGATTGDAATTPAAQP